MKIINKFYLFNRSPIEENNTSKFDCDEEVENSKQCVITAFSPIEDFNKLLENGFNSAIGIPKFCLSRRNTFYLLYCVILCSYIDQIQYFK